MDSKRLQCPTRIAVTSRDCPSCTLSVRHLRCAIDNRDPPTPFAVRRVRRPPSLTIAARMLRANNARASAPHSYHSNSARIFLPTSFRARGLALAARANNTQSIRKIRKLHTAFLSHFETRIIRRNSAPNLFIRTGYSRSRGISAVACPFAIEAIRAGAIVRQLPLAKRGHLKQV
jgi:hypothetical protein